MIAISHRLIAQIRPLIHRLIKLRVFIFILFFLGTYGFLIMRVSNLVQSEPPATAIESSDKSIQQLSIDKDAVARIEQLQAQNVQVQALFQNARNNPFSE